MRPRFASRCSVALLAALLFAALLFWGCGASETTVPAAQTSAPSTEHGGQGDGIAWFEGSVDDAFALARREGKPVFLYWGAVWCPPCHYLKNKTFRRPEFVEKSRGFVAVYLDGDTERAQILGERFKTQGYPTVILFDSGGRELVRVSTGIPVEEYASILDAALAGLRPVHEVLADVREGGAATAEPADLELLAFHSWNQDSGLDLSPEERVSVAKALWEETQPDLRVVRSRFLALWLEAAENLSEAERAEAIPAVERLLGDPELRRANLGLLAWGSRPLIDLLAPEGSPERPELAAAWEQAAIAVEEDESLPADDRLSALFPRFEIARLRSNIAEEESYEPPAELREHLRERVAWAAETVTDEGELQAVVNTMASLLENAGLASEAEALLLEKMDQTKAPYYYMSWLAGLKHEAGQDEEALRWYRRAYDTSEGRYTRFRWGSSYLRQLMQLAPEDAAKIEASSKEIVGELLSNDDAFAGGNNLRLGQLGKAYGEWSEGKPERAAVVGSVRELVHGRCDDFPEEGEDSQRERCRAFLAAAETASEPGVVG